MRFSPTKSFLFWFIFVTKEILTSGDRQRFISTPEKPTTIFNGGNVSLVWRYYNPAHITLIQVVFGYWKSPGYVYPRMMTINGTTNIPRVIQGYEKAISWAGDTASCLAAFILHDMQPADGTVEFGIHLEFGYRYNPLIDSVRVKVEENRDQQRFISTPEKPIQVFIESNVSLIWRYHKPAYLTLIRVTFGYWKSPGYVYPRMMTVNGTTNIPKVMPRYETSIAWAGDTASSLAAFVLYNIHPRAEGTVDFGIHLEFGHRYNPLMDSVRIRVKEKDLAQNSVEDKNAYRISGGDDVTNTTKDPGIISKRLHGNGMSPIQPTF